jgi:plasmid maintenance system antidote protein VapI
MKYERVEYQTLPRRILDIAREKVRNGEFTERGMAKHLGVSQSHMHNVLAGVRPLTPELLDSMLRGFGMSLLDLFNPEELRQHLAARERRAG